MIDASTDFKVRLSSVEIYLAQARRELCLPGVAVAIVQDGHIVYRQGLGFAAPGRSMTPQTPLILGSLSKSFPALAILQLAEAGKLGLDDPVQRYIPWFRLADPTASSAITIRHLLSHTSGISRYTGRELLAGRGGRTLEQGVRALSTLKLTRPVGTFQYSNVNYAIAGLIIEIVTGQPFGDYIERQVFEPLGMLHSFASEERAQRGGLASGYRWWFGVPVPCDAPYLEDALPAAFIASSAEDMARYLLALLNGGSLDGASVLPPAGVAELHRAQISINATASYALGWRVEQSGQYTIIRHSGEVANFLSEMVLVPELHLGVVALMNVNNGLVPQALPHEVRLASHIVHQLLGLPPQPHRLSFRGLSTLLNAAMIGLSAYQVWSLVRLMRSRQRGLTRSWLTMFAEIVAAIGAGCAIPRLADAPWRLLRLYVPDVSLWFSAFCSCVLIKAIVRLAGAARQRAR
jgi:CubicO group peptidase (beta-lactamase class C family)